MVAQLTFRPAAICLIVVSRWGNTLDAAPHLGRDQHRVKEARALLGSVYGRFTEGFVTADLREAKSLLQELE
jgi:predicted ATPase